MVLLATSSFVQKVFQRFSDSFLVTNRITWEVSRIVRVYRHRWTGTETFHRDGKTLFQK
jgi:hypothetical protein